MDKKTRDFQHLYYLDTKMVDPDEDSIDEGAKELIYSGLAKSELQNNNPIEITIHHIESIYEDCFTRDIDRFNTIQLRVFYESTSSLRTCDLTVHPAWVSAYFKSIRFGLGESDDYFNLGSKGRL